LSDPVAAAPFGETGVGLVAGEVPDLTAIDRRFRADGKRTEVRLGRLQAWRYAGLRPRKGLAATPYLAPTTGAPLLVVCHARVRTARARLRECEDIASTIVLKEEEPASLVRVDRHEQQVASVLGNLRRERVQGRQRLAEVKLASDQVRVARLLERHTGRPRGAFGVSIFLPARAAATISSARFETPPRRTDSWQERPRMRTRPGTARRATPSSTARRRFSARRPRNGATDVT
jgi:hypothetical protein